MFGKHFEAFFRWTLLCLHLSDNLSSCNRLESNLRNNDHTNQNTIIRQFNTKKMFYQPRHLFSLVHIFNHLKTHSFSKLFEIIIICLLNNDFAFKTKKWNPHKLFAHSHLFHQCLLHHERRCELLSSLTMDALMHARLHRNIPVRTILDHRRHRPTAQEGLARLAAAGPSEQAAGADDWGSCNGRTTG